MLWKPLLLLALSAVSAGLLAQPPREPLRTSDGPALPRLEFLKVLGAGHRSLVADYYWLLTIQQVGRARTKEQYRDVFFYADMATSLDPRFHLVYPFSAVGVTHNLGREQWVNTDESTRLVRKGLDVFPRDQHLRFLLAFNQMYYHRQYHEAADMLTELSREPGAPSFLSALATRLYAQAGRFDTGLAMASALRDSAQDEESRAFFERRMVEIQLERVLQDVDRAAREFAARQGRTAARVEDLLASGDLEAMPVDPLEGTIFLDESGRAQSTSMRKRLRLIHQSPQWVEDP